MIKNVPTLVANSAAPPPCPSRHSFARPKAPARADLPSCRPMNKRRTPNSPPVSVPFRQNELCIPFQSLVETLVATSHSFIMRAATTNQDRTPLIPVDPGSQGMLSTTLGPLVCRLESRA